MNTNASSIASSAQQAVSAAAAAASRQTDAVTLTSGANSSADTSANVGASGAVAGAGIPGGAGGDWRDKDADRSARQQIARIILTLIMKSANRPASVNYNPREIARRLEHTLYMSASSRDEYSNVQTLKARLQQALDNSRRRQMQQQQQQQQSTPTSQATDLQQQQQQAQAQQLQQQQLQLLQRQQQQMAAHLQSQRNSFQGVPFAATPVQIPQQPATSQQLQMPLSVSMQVNNPSAVSMVTTTSTTNVGTQNSGSSILDELEREADEMANGVSDEPIAMPESELQDAAAVPTSIAGNFGGASTSVATSSVAPTVAGAQFNPVALSMPPEISAGLSSPSVPASAGFGLQPNPTMVAAVPGTVGGSNLYHGMNLTGPQIQQLQQLQQMQQLRRMQQMQLQQQQQHVANVASMGLNPSATGNQLQRGAPTTVPVTSASPVTPTAGTPTGMAQMTEASIAQKREELKRRLIQLKHARTCTTGESKLPNGNDAAQLSAGVKTESKTAAAGDLNELKKKPLKFQTEKEKKLRRKEQAKIAKARAQAKAQAASNGAVVPGTPVSGKPAAPAKAAPVLSNGLVVRGSQASLRSDQHVSHQDISYLDSMTERQLDEHIRSLRFNFCGHITLTELKNRLMPLITKLMESEYGWTFNNPVDPVQWNIPDYFDIIKCPMDLGTIKKRLENEHYNSVEAFAGDVRLVFENCIAYNSSTNKFNQAAKQLLASFDKSLAALKNQLEKQLFKRLDLVPDAYADTPTTTVIHLTAATPTDGAPSAGPTAIVPFDGVLKKSSLLKRKNSEVAEEPWVESSEYLASNLPLKMAGKDEAERMGNLGNSDSIGFSRGVDEPVSETHFGVTIREVLSIDKQVQIKPKMGKLLAAHYGKPKKSETKSGSGVNAGGTGQTKSLKRQRTSSTDSATKKRNGNAVGPTTTAQSLQLTYRSRCICVFQELDGVDVLIFTLYVQEYGPDSLEPNAGRVYVSYLDSVNYFQPKKLRTLMHQQVMLGFLEDCKNRGFHTAHIWSCPPLKGDDYIFFCKPENQKIPKSARLRQWYQKLLQQAKKDGLVYNISNLYAEYYMKKKAAHELPYFEGDYWPRLAEDLIKQIEEKTSGGRSGEKSSGSANAEDQVENSNDQVDSNAPTPGSLSPSEAGTLGENENVDEPSVAPTGKTSKKAGKHSKSKKKRSKKSKTSSVDAPASSTRSSTTKTRSKKGGQLGRPLGSSKNVVNSDPLMQKLKGILEPQKDDFFVVDLYPKCHKCSVPIVKVGYWELKTLPPSNSVIELLDAVKKTRASSSSSRNSPPRHYHHYYCSTCYEATKTQLLHRVELASSGAKRAEELSARILPMNEKAAASELADLDLQEIKYAVSLGFVDPNEDKTKVKTEEDEKEKPSSDEKDDGGDVVMKTEGDPDAAKNSATSESKPAAPAVGTVVKAKDKAVTKTRVSDDDLDDVIMPCEIFDTREAFLMYCQNNHCQFDQIRRAKHSSMMVLYHLFNQGTTGFTFSCSGCKIALTSGNRWNCSICPVFNLCDECNAKTKHEHQLHLFKVVPIPKPGEQSETNVPAAGAIGAGKGALLAAQASGATAAGPGRPIKREAGSSELKRAKLDKTNSIKNAKTTTGPSRKRKLNQTSSPVKAAAGGDVAGAANAATASMASTVAAPSTTFSGDGVAPAAIQASADGTAPSSAAAAPASASATTASGDAASASATPTSQESGTANSSAADEDPNKKQRRIHNIDPQLLLQLEHASSCTVVDCTFFNCHRMRSMLKHGAMCEQRLAGPCVLCKRIVGLLSAHARQCEKDYSECKVPRCADIRRHFMQQMQQRQEQMERLKQQQQQPVPATQPAQPDQKVVVAVAEPVAANPEDSKDAAN
uniref:histone acetyltransferase n=1 Tax=Globisporangium ultimum (strain ATCC 200006 / CBS 805.95 / DAOM BR144) TaxID=431595 RepID=K3WVF0_GLOUD